jgi:hypothetical protein
LLEIAVVEVQSLTADRIQLLSITQRSFIGQATGPAFADMHGLREIQPPDQ